ncbi:hypothetical protein [Azospirillum canadense]|uniref:hypothetical protein n=1 Tax=Azospirillum canadense TaxID=403962 RepID=UPI002226FE09|nr:hypothetical protein [Azospirillum canadense]MCW2241490.1 hypothetical protein [Azospirillum canadense]
MPRTFDGQILEDAIHCIRVSDVVSDEAKACLIGAVLALGQAHCKTVPCGVCSSAERCEDRIGSILNDEVDVPAGQSPKLRVVPLDAA